MNYFRIIIDGPGSTTVFNGPTPLLDALYTGANHFIAGMFKNYIYPFRYICTHKHMRVLIATHTHTHARTHTHTHIREHIYVPIYTYAYTHIHTHTYTLACIHIIYIYCML